MRKWGAAALAAVAMLVPQIVATSPAHPDTASIQQYPVPGSGLSPDAIVRGPDGNLWFTATGPQKVGRITTDGVVTQFAVAGHPTGITVGPDGNLWFIEPQDKQVGRMSPDGTVLDQFPVPWLQFPQGEIEGITLGPDNHVWISDESANMVGWVDPTGAITAYTVTGGPFALTAGPDGNLWFTEQHDNKIAKLDPTTGTVLAEYQIPGSVPGAFVGLADIVTGPDGNLWFTERYKNNIGRITPQGDLTLFPIPTGNAGPAGITVGPDGNLWFTEYSGNRIGRITPAGDITEIHVLASGLLDIATGPDGHLWFTAAGSGQIDELDPTTIVGRPPPCLIVTQSLTLTHDVGPCPGTGIVVVADNVKLDLNGHKVFAAPGPRYGDFPGILLRDASGVTVSNGTVTGFDAGVAVEGGSANTITRLNVHHNRGGAPSGTYGDGIVLSSSSANQVVNNVVNHNGYFDGIGIIGLDSNNNVIRANRVTSTDFADGIVVNPFVGFDSPRFGESVTGNKVIGNLVRDSFGSGISSLSNVGGLVRGNRVEHNGFARDGSSEGGYPGNGIGVQSNIGATLDTNDFVDSNTITGNFGDGIQVISDHNRVANNSVTSPASAFAGIELFGGRFNSVVTNTSVGAAFYALLDGQPDCDTNVWRANVWSGDIYPDCTGAGGHQVPAPAAAARQSPAAPVPTRAPWVPVIRHHTTLDAAVAG